MMGDIPWAYMFSFMRELCGSTLTVHGLWCG